ncbi:MAG TPA: efflux RND transporter periplasmic adaptor subunit [Pirellulaceae bacterium]|nr:efflux RND transporter periplasmic adaptor subunit [Pirellulaceae bacterium]
MATVATFAALGLGVWWYWSRNTQRVTIDPLTTQVINAPFDHTVVEQGEVESSMNVEIRCAVKSRNAGGTDILWVIPEGTIVEAGQELVKLDSSALEQERDQQKITCNTTLATKVQSQNTYEAAAIARTEYLEGTFKQEKQLIQSEIFVAEENLRRADQYAKFSERLALKGYVTTPQLEGDRFAVSKAKSDLELAKTKLFVAENYTREKMLRTLESDIVSAKAKWDADEESYKLELKKLADMEQQVAGCVIKSPQAGQVVYANVPNSRGGTAEFIVEAGSKVREGQAILRMPDTRKMQVKAKINESRVTFVRPGQPVTIKIDALDGAVLNGTVKRVSSFAEPTSFFGSNTKQYGTEITILDPPSNIRTGLTAEVNIQIEYANQALQVPVQAVLENAGKTYCLINDGNRWVPQEITIGSTNDKFIRVESGLSAQQIVAANPRQHLELFPFIKNGVIEPSPSKIPDGADIAARKNDLAPPALGSAPPGGDAKKKRPSPAEMFKGLDVDSDGKLSAEEYSAVDARMRDRLGNADANNDTFVDQSELSAAFVKMRASFTGGGPGGPEGGAGGGGFGGPPGGGGQ